MCERRPKSFHWSPESFWLSYYVGEVLHHRHCGKVSLDTARLVARQRNVTLFVHYHTNPR